MKKQYRISEDEFKLVNTLRKADESDIENLTNEILGLSDTILNKLKLTNIYRAVETGTTEDVKRLHFLVQLSTSLTAIKNSKKDGEDEE